MIDIHCHILPGMDDGPASLEESLKMCKIAYNDGIRIIVATPHTLNGLYLNGKEEIRNLVEILNSKTDIDIKILPGADVHISPDIPELIEDGNIMTINDNMRYILIEFPYMNVPQNIDRFLFSLKKRGITPIITHPERNLAIQRDIKIMYELLKMGALSQITGMSITGDFGRDVRVCAENLLTHNLVHIISSDAHSQDLRPPILSKGFSSASRIVGRELALKMVKDNPFAVINGIYL